MFLNKKYFFGVIAALFLVILAYIFKPITSVSTDNAYLKSDIISVKPKVSGYIINIFVNENEAVKLGQVLAKIDDSDYQLKLNIAEANLKANQEKINSAKLELKLQEFNISKAKFDSDAASASFDLAQKNLKRSKTLIKNNTISQKELDQSLEAEKKAADSFSATQSVLSAANLKKDILLNDINNAKFVNDSLENIFKLAKLDFEYTQVRAKTDGLIGKNNFQIGQYTTPNVTLAYLVQNNVWILANFKETQVEKIKPNQNAIIEIDTFPGKKFFGKVESLAPATGAEFSLLPPENATGNFTKIVQRIPVKVIFDKNQDLTMLKSGMSCTVQIKFN